MSAPATYRHAVPRQRPEGWPVMHQTWDKLLFLHWPISVEELRPLIPAKLEIETWDGTAWIGVTPLAIRGIRPPFVPPLPLVSRTLELNVRTYVSLDGVSGVWFFSLDASNPLAVWGARLGFALPYFRASISMTAADGQETFQCSRAGPERTPAEFSAQWRRASQPFHAEPNSRDFFLIERYCLYSSSGGRLYRADIRHRPWPLTEAHVERVSSSVVASHGLPEPQGAPLVHAQAAPLDVWAWPPRRVD